MTWKFPVSITFFSFLSSLGTFVGFCFWILVHIGSHPLLFARRHREMKLGCVIETVVALYLLFSPAQSLPLSSINSTMEVLMFQEVWGRSFCRTIEKLVEVVQEYPTEVEHIYSPSCVPLVRCAGCCGDENLECHPTHTTNVTMQLLKIRPSEPDQEYVEMTFVEHQTCE
ncbi:placenta growth factor isoform X2 [Embiotoca jacksoni]